MIYLVITLLGILQVNPADSVQLADRITISTDLPQTPHAEPHLSINPKNPEELLLASVVLPDSSRHRVDAFRSIDKGQSWTREKLPTADSLGTIDPWTGFDRRNNAFVSLLTATTFADNNSFMGFELFKQTNAGSNNWRKTYSHVLERGKGGSFDQPKLTIDHAINSDYTNRLYMSSSRWGRPTKLRNSTQAVALLYSHDSGHSFSDIEYVAENNFKKQSLNPVVLSDGTLVGGFYNYMTTGSRFFPANPVWTFTSLDGGASTTYPNIVTTRGIDMPLLAADTTSNGYHNRIYMAGVTAEPDTVLSVLYSDSRGQKWSKTKEIAELPAAHKIAHYAAVDGKGRLGIIWTERVSKNKDKECCRVNFSHSWNGGENFATRPVLKEKHYCLNIPGEARMYAMAGEYRPVNPRFSKGGEYLGLVGLPEGGFYAVWVQTVNGTLQLTGSRIHFSN